MAIGGEASNTVLNEFISGTENKVITAQDASQIQECFKFVTMSVTTRTNSQNANIIPKSEEIDKLIEEELSQQSEEFEDNDDPFS